MDTLRIATILGGRHRFQKVAQTGSQDCGERVVERKGGVDVQPSRLFRGRRCVGRQVEAARCLAADRWAHVSVVCKRQRHLIDGGRAAVLELQFDLADRHRAIAGPDESPVEGNFDHAGRQVDEALVPVNVGNEDCLQRLAREVGPELGRNEGHGQADIGGEGGDARLPLAAPQRIVFGG